MVELDLFEPLTPDQVALVAQLKAGLSQDVLVSWQQRVACVSSHHNESIGLQTSFYALNVVFECGVCRPAPRIPCVPFPRHACPLRRRATSL